MITVPPISSPQPASMAEPRSQHEGMADHHAGSPAREAQAKAGASKQDDPTTSDAQKVAARQKIERIKTQLRVLQMSGPVNPVMLAQLARELKAAVGDYTSAGGASIDIAADAATAAIARKDEEDASAEANGRAPKSIEGQVEGINQNPARAHGPQSRGGEDGRADGDKASDGQGESDPYRRMAGAQARAADLTRRTGDAADRREFREEVTTLAGRIRDLASHAAQAHGDPSSRADAEEAGKIAVDLEHEVQATLDDGDSVGVSMLA